MSGLGRQRTRPWTVLAVLMAWLVVAARVQAQVGDALPLRGLLNDSDLVAVARVVDFRMGPVHGIGTLQIVQVLHGEHPKPRLEVSPWVDGEQLQMTHALYAPVGSDVLVFVDMLVGSPVARPASGGTILLDGPEDPLVTAFGDAIVRYRRVQDDPDAARRTARTTEWIVQLIEDEQLRDHGLCDLIDNNRSDAFPLLAFADDHLPRLEAAHVERLLDVLCELESSSWAAYSLARLLVDVSDRRVDALFVARLRARAGVFWSTDVRDARLLADRWGDASLDELIEALDAIEVLHSNHAPRDATNTRAVQHGRVALAELIRLRAELLLAVGKPWPRTTPRTR